MVLIKKVRSYSRRFAAAKAPDIEEAVEVREKEDYKLVKTNQIVKLQIVAGETQQRQVTETIKGDLKDKP
jgi:hypothetical protein